MPQSQNEPPNELFGVGFGYTKPLGLALVQGTLVLGTLVLGTLVPYMRSLCLRSPTVPNERCIFSVIPALQLLLYPQSCPISNFWALTAIISTSGPLLR